MEEALIKRIMPHSVEAEQSVVGAMLMDKDAVMTASEIISGQDFYQTSYGVVFDSMVELFNEGKPVDVITLQERLKEKDVPPEISSTRSALKPSSPAEMFTVPPLRRTQPRLPSVSLVALMPSLVAVTVMVPSRIST